MTRPAREPEAPLVLWREHAGRREGLACQVAGIDGYPVGERLLQRWQQLQEIGPRIHKRLAQTRTVVRDQDVGRNEPCPCGSGKKCKKCCLGRE